MKFSLVQWKRGYAATETALNYCKGVLILLFLVAVTSSVPLPSPPQTPRSENPIKPSGRRISLGSSSPNDALSTSTHLTPPVPKTVNAEQVTDVHVTKEVRRVAFQIVEEVSGTKNLIFTQNSNNDSADENLEPTEVEAPGTTPTTVPLVTASSSLDRIKSSTSVAYSIEIHKLPIVETISNLPITETTSTSISLNISNANGTKVADDFVSPSELSSHVAVFDPVTDSSPENTSQIDSNGGITLTTSLPKAKIPSTEKTSRITVAEAPANKFVVPENPNFDVDILLNDAPSSSIKADGHSKVNENPEEQSPHFDGTKSESLKSIPTDQLNSSHNDSQNPQRKTSEKLFPLELENEEKLVDLILNNKNLQRQFKTPKDLNPASQSDKPSPQSGVASIIDGTSPLDIKNFEKQHIKLSFVRTRNVEPEAFFSISKEESIPVKLKVNATDDVKKKEDNIEIGQTEKAEVSPVDKTGEYTPPAYKRNSSPNKSIGSELDHQEDQLEHQPSANVANRDPALPIEDSEENTFTLNSRVRHVETKGHFETRTQGYDGANEDSSEEVRNHRIHPKSHHEPRALLPPSQKEQPILSNESFDDKSNYTRTEKAELILPSSGRIVEAKTSGNSHLIPSILESQSSEPILHDDYTPDSLADYPRQVPVSEPIKDVMGPGSVAAIVLGVLLFSAAALGGFAFIVYNRQTDIRPKVLSDRSCANSDSGGYIDDQCRVAYVNSQLDVPKGTPEDLVSLDNDSFLNSLESMTIQNLWTDSIRHTKL